MNIKTYMLAGLAALSMASCDESFNDWTDQAANSQAEAVTFGNGSVTAVGLIDFKALAADQDSVAVCTLTAPTSTSAAYTSTYSLLVSHKDDATGQTTVTTLPMSQNGKVAVADLKGYVEQAYGKKPVERDLPSMVRFTISNGATATYLESSEFTVKVKPEAPMIDEGGYYYIGGANNWKKDDMTYHLVNSGRDVYDDPVFTVVIPAPKNADGTNADNWFKIVAAQSMKDFPGDNDDKFNKGVVIGAAVNGMSDAEGTFIEGNTDVQAWNIKFDKGDYYKITLDMMARTYKVEALNFAQYFYVAGDANGWGANDFLSTSTYDGKYKGFMWLGKEFKFRTHDGDDWSDNYGGANGKLESNGGNIAVPAEGYYMVETDLTQLTYTLTPITTIGLIGDATPGGWSDDTPMTYNREAGCWEAKGVTLNDGGLKFRANNDWAINWGGKALGALTQGGDNLNVKAGKYDIQLFALCDGKAYATLTPAK